MISQHIYWKSTSSVRAHSKQSLLRFTPQVSSLQFSSLLLRCIPHLKLSFTAEHVLPELCLEWEPIQNSHLHIKMVTAQVYFSSLLLKFLVLKFQVYSSSLPHHLKLSVMDDQFHIGNLCVQWEPIWKWSLLKFTPQVSSPQVSSLLLKWSKRKTQNEFIFSVLG